MPDEFDAMISEDPERFERMKKKIIREMKKNPNERPRRLVPEVIKSTRPSKKK
jgi:hypothetical protein